MLGHENCAQHVNRIDPLPVFAGPVLGPAKIARDPGVVDQDVDTAVGAEAQIDETLDLLLHRYVHRFDHRFPARLPHRGQGFLEAFFLDIGQDQFSPFPGKQNGRGPPDAAGRPGDDGYFVFAVVRCYPSGAPLQL